MNPQYASVPLREPATDSQSTNQDFDFVQRSITILEDELEDENVSARRKAEVRADLKPLRAERGKLLDAKYRWKQNNTPSFDGTHIPPLLLLRIY